MLPKYIFVLLIIILFFIQKTFRYKKGRLKYSKNNLILKEILEVAYTSELVEEAGLKIIKILSKYFYYNYCSLYKYDEKRDSLNIICSTVPSTELKNLIDIGNYLLNKEFSDAYIESSNLPLNYKSTYKRGVKYIYFIPLEIGNAIIGALLIEKTNPYSKNEEKEFETEFFEVVTETITLALQNLIYFEKIRDSAYIDGLTQIYNRKYMDIFLPKKTKAYVHNNINFAIVMFDIDYFKKFNDTYGHQFGDLVLRELSKIVSKNIREIDVLFRYGGEEFVIFMPNITKETVFNRIDNMRKRVADLIIVDEKGMSAQVTCSFGISVFPSASNDGNIKKLINEADTALYFSKESGRNKVTLYGEELKLCN